MLILSQPSAQVSKLFEITMREVAKRNDTVRFVKMDNSDAEIEDAGVPAILAYRGGEKFADILALVDQFPDDCELSAISLETVMRQ